MITANQGARLRAANHIRTATEEISKALPLICLTQQDRKHLHKALSELSIVFGRLIPNEDEGTRGER